MISDRNATCIEEGEGEEEHAEEEAITTTTRPTLAAGPRPASCSHAHSLQLLGVAPMFIHHLMLCFPKPYGRLIRTVREVQSGQLSVGGGGVDWTILSGVYYASQH